MIIPYCLNIHPGESLADIRNAVTSFALQVKARVAPDKSYPLGMRISAAAAQMLNTPSALLSFQQLLAQNNLYVSVINGFPYGTFHRTCVKADVYKPDWSTSERVQYTKKLSDILAAILPEGKTGNISTVPLSYKLNQSVETQLQFIYNITSVAAYLHDLKRNTGHTIILAIEPEPDCIIANSDEIIEWFNNQLMVTGAEFLLDHYSLKPQILHEHIGICLDTCHFAVEFEDPLAVIKRLEANDIKIARIQLSSALSTTISAESLKALVPFIDPVYLHQTKIRNSDGSIVSMPDLTEDTLAEALQYKGSTLRTHFHVPMFFDGTDTLQSTNSDLSPQFFEHIRKHRYELETETYTYDVLPPAIKPSSVIDSLVMEHEWVIDRL